jgi:predicted oxidoreductase
MAAAIEAATAGARVLVVEAQAEYGGAAATSGGGTCIAGTSLQEQLGIHDSPDLALADWLAWGGPEVQADWAERYLGASNEELFVWLASLGVEWVAVRPQEGNRVPRWHAPKGNGRGLMQPLRAHASSLPIELVYGTRACGLVHSAGRVVGVEAERSDGTRLDLRGDSVLIAAGGFNSNPSMVRQYTAQAANGQRVLLGGARCSLGTGHALLADAGAAFDSMDAVWMYPYGTPDPHDALGERGLVLRGMDGDIWVTREGIRFHDESKRGGATGTAALLALEPATCWSIVDARVASGITIADPAYRDATSPNALLDHSAFIHRGDSMADLADAAGLNRVNLQRTVAQFNHLVDSGESLDPDFGRPLQRLHALEQPPFYAIQFLPLARKNLGGVRTDLDCRVLREDGSAIAGLFAAGEVAGMAGGHINGRAALEGTMLGPSLYSGRVAARAMVGVTV